MKYNQAQKMNRKLLIVNIKNKFVKKKNKLTKFKILKTLSNK